MTTYRQGYSWLCVFNICALAIRYIAISMVFNLAIKTHPTVLLDVLQVIQACAMSLCLELYAWSYQLMFGYQNYITISKLDILRENSHRIKIKIVFIHLKWLYSSVFQTLRYMGVV